MTKHFSGKILYTASRLTPEEIIAAGGITENGKPCVINTETGHNDGCVAFSLLPQVTTLFCQQEAERSTHNQVHIYAFPFIGEFICPGKQWYEVISPSAFPLPNWWLARKVEKIDYDGNVRLGPLRGQFGHIGSLQRGEDFHHYLNNTLIQPDKHYGDESITLHDVDSIATPYAKNFLKEVSNHYQSTLNIRYSTRRP